MRFTDTPNLFGYGSGRSTCGDFKCAICGTMYNEGNDATETYEDDPIRVTTFAGVEVCGDCFEAIEVSVYNRMQEILKWYGKILQSQRANLAKREQELAELLDLTKGRIGEIA